MSQSDNNNNVFIAPAGNLLNAPSATPSEDPAALKSFGNMVKDFSKNGVQATKRHIGGGAGIAAGGYAGYIISSAFAFADKPSYNVGLEFAGVLACAAIGYANLHSMATAKDAAKSLNSPKAVLGIMGAGLGLLVGSGINYIGSHAMNGLNGPVNWERFHDAVDITMAAVGIKIAIGGGKALNLGDFNVRRIVCFGAAAVAGYAIQALSNPHIAKTFDAWNGSNPNWQNATNYIANVVNQPAQDVNSFASTAASVGLGLLTGWFTYKLAEHVTSKNEAAKPSTETPKKRSFLKRALYTTVAVAALAAGGIYYVKTHDNQNATVSTDTNTQQTTTIQSQQTQATQTPIAEQAKICAMDIFRQIPGKGTVMNSDNYTTIPVNGKEFEISPADKSKDGSVWVLAQRKDDPQTTGWTSRDALKHCTM